MNKTELIQLRAFQMNDLPFILSTWLRGLRFGNSWYQLINASVYFTVYQKVIEKILSLPTTSVQVACLIDDPDVILGFSVYDGPRLHWVYVKQAWRKIGIATMLVPNTITVVSHLTEVGKSLMVKKKLEFNPFLLF